MDNDNMEIGETGLIPTPYGFYNIETGQKLDHDGKEIQEDTKED